MAVPIMQTGKLRLTERKSFVHSLSTANKGRARIKCQAPEPLCLTSNHPAGSMKDRCEPKGVGLGPGHSQPLGIVLRMNGWVRSVPE